MSQNILSNIVNAAIRFMYKPEETFNPAYSPHQDGRRFYSTHMYINGEYFKSKNKNNYYKILPKNTTLADLMREEYQFHEFKPAPRLVETIKMNSGKPNPYYDPKFDCIVKLEIEDDKEYFVENNQNLSALEKVRVTIMSDITNEDELIYKLSQEKFEPVPDTDYWP
jgi:hypothetical protein